MAVGLYSNVGARSEPNHYSGLAHMVEHMVFKGAAGRNARMIAEAAENCGGQLNAWTARDHTVFQARMLSEYWDLGLELVADLVRSPTLDGEELEREKGVVLSNWVNPMIHLMTLSMITYNLLLLKIKPWGDRFK